ncbi:MAG TPA: hypothetical protein VMY39_06980 [Planctomycetota bacterium]|nr:hypothetical protein [Planctomycetota bacterium]
MKPAPEHHEVFRLATARMLWWCFACSDIIMHRERFWRPTHAKLREWKRGLCLRCRPLDGAK